MAESSKDALSAPDGEATLSITFKQSGAAQFSLVLKPSLTVVDVKIKAEAHCNVPPSQQRLIYRGRILKDHEVLSTLSISDGHIMHLVKSGGVAAPPPPVDSGATTAGLSTSHAQNTAAQTTTHSNVPPTTPANPFLQGMGNHPGNLLGMPGMSYMPDPAQIQAMMQNPMVQQVMNQMMQNPEMLRSILQSDPAVQSATQQNPILRSIAENPELIRTFMSPEMLRLQGNAAGVAQPTSTVHEGGVPGGANTPGMAQANAGGMADMMRMSMQLMQENPDLVRNVFQNPGAFGMPGMPGMSGMGGMPGGAPGTTGVTGDTSGTNPMANPLFASMFGGGGIPPATDTRPPAERYRVALLRLQEMGFIDRDANLQALTESQGDVDAAITRLLDRGIGN